MINPKVIPNTRIVWCQGDPEYSWNSLSNHRLCGYLSLDSAVEWVCPFTHWGRLRTDIERMVARPEAHDSR